MVEAIQEKQIGLFPQEHSTVETGILTETRIPQVFHHLHFYTPGVPHQEKVLRERGSQADIITFVHGTYSTRQEKEYQKVSDGKNAPVTAINDIGWRFAREKHLFSRTHQELVAIRGLKKPIFLLGTALPRSFFRREMPTEDPGFPRDSKFFLGDFLHLPQGDIVTEVRKFMQQYAQTHRSFQTTIFEQLQELPKRTSQRITTREPGLTSLTVLPRAQSGQIELLQNEGRDAISSDPLRTPHAVTFKDRAIDLVTSGREIPEEIAIRIPFEISITRFLMKRFNAFANFDRIAQWSTQVLTYFDNDDLVSLHAQLNQHDQGFFLFDFETLFRKKCAEKGISLYDQDDDGNPRNISFPISES